MASSQLLVVATLRPPEAGSDAAVTIGELVRLPNSVLVTIQPLDEAAVRLQMREIAGGEPDQEIRRRVLELSAGIPLYVEELVAAAGGSQEISSRLALTFTSRLRGCSPTATILGAAALARQPFDVATLQAITGGPEEDVRAAMAESARGGLIDQLGGGQYRFHHVLLQRGFERAQPAPQRESSGTVDGRALRIPEPEWCG